MESPNARVCANNPGKPAGNTVLVVHEYVVSVGEQDKAGGGKDVTILSRSSKKKPIEVPWHQGQCLQ